MSCCVCPWRLRNDRQSFASGENSCVMTNEGHLMRQQPLQDHDSGYTIRRAGYSHLMTLEYKDHSGKIVIFYLESWWLLIRNWTAKADTEQELFITVLLLEEDRRALNGSSWAQCRIWKQLRIVDQDLNDASNLRICLTDGWDEVPVLR